MIQERREFTPSRIRGGGMPSAPGRPRRAGYDRAVSGTRDGNAAPVVLTGGTSGIGRAAALQFAARGLPLVLGVRSIERGEDVRDEILALNPDARVDLIPLDLADLTSVLEFAAAYTAGFPPWRALVNNAGVTLAPARRLTVDGFELHLGVNHLGHFALTGLMLPSAADDARVVTITSLAARFGRILFHDLRFDHGYRSFRAYAASMRANLLFARELQRKADEEGLRIRSIAASPGASVPPDRLRGPLGPPTRAVGRDFTAGAAPLVTAATDAALRGAKLIGPGRLGHTAGRPVVLPAPRIRNEEQVAKRLWRLSGQLTRVRW